MPSKKRAAQAALAQTSVVGAPQPVAAAVHPAELPENADLAGMPAIPASRASIPTKKRRARPSASKPGTGLMAAVRELQGREKMVQAQHWPATPPAPAAVAPDKADKKRQRKPKIAEASVLAVVEAVSNTVVKEEPASEEPQEDAAVPARAVRGRKKSQRHSAQAAGATEDAPALVAIKSEALPPAGPLPSEAAPAGAARGRKNGQGRSAQAASALDNAPALVSVKSEAPPPGPLTAEAAPAGMARGRKKSRRRSAQAAGAADDAPVLVDVKSETLPSGPLPSEALPDAPVQGKRRRRAVKKEEAEPAAALEGEEEAEVKKKPRRRGPDPDAYVIPTPDILPEAEAADPGPRPVPNLGYACLNATLRAQRPPIFTNRDCIKKTFETKGLDYISELALENVRALPAIYKWNQEHGIQFFRMSSNIFPWCTEYEFKQLKDQDAIAEALAFAGKLARAYRQRLTFHPSHFVKLAANTEELLNRSICELEWHSLVFDLMGYAPSPENKINIHIGGNYGDKPATLDRFADNFQRLSPNLKLRLTIENDDQPNSYSVTDLLPLAQKIGVPLVFDFHHHQFCQGGLSEEEALRAALATWPKGVRPVVHWSESQEGRKPFAHSDFIKGPLRLYGMDTELDIMVEAKCKELAVLRFRDPGYQMSPHVLQAAAATE